jgi:uracil-DNA glycosylase
MQLKPLDESWSSVLREEFIADYFANLVHLIQAEKNEDKTIYPPASFIFRAFDSTPFSKVKVVILGQDPYHGEGQAHGLCFSVPKGVKLPPSLKNIYRELQACYPTYKVPTHGCLLAWATQGVFLLNAILTVRANEPASHAKIGWETFTDAVIRHLSDEREHLVFILWGAFAKSKAHLIDETKHLILTSGHPSFAASHKQFFGHHHFLKCNEYLEKTGQTAIDWQISNE